MASAREGGGSDERCRAGRAALAAGWVIAGACFVACGEGGAGFEVGEAWARPTLPAGAVPTGVPQAPAAVYLTVSNRGARADRLLDAATPLARVVELHETQIEGDRARMVRLLDGAEIPAGGTLALRPGGKHLMLIDLRRHLEPGESFPLTLRFAAAGERTVTVEVRE